MNSVSQSLSLSLALSPGECWWESRAGLPFSLLRRTTDASPPSEIPYWLLKVRRKHPLYLRNSDNNSKRSPRVSTLYLCRVNTHAQIARIAARATYSLVALSISGSDHLGSQDFGSPKIRWPCHREEGSFFHDALSRGRTRRSARVTACRTPPGRLRRGFAHPRRWGSRTTHTRARIRDSPGSLSVWLPLVALVAAGCCGRNTASLSRALCLWRDGGGFRPARGCQSGTASRQVRERERRGWTEAEGARGALPVFLSTQWDYEARQAGWTQEV